MYSRFNIHAYPSVYGDKCLGILAQNLPPKGYHQAYLNNICILGNAGDPYLDVGGLPGGEQGCLDGTSTTKAAFEDGLLVSNNTIYVPGGVATVNCTATSTSRLAISRAFCQPRPAPPHTRRGSCAAACPC